MPKSFAKVQKKISKKRGNTSSLNENSRDAQKLRRAGARDDKLARLSVARAKVNQPHSTLWHSWSLRYPVLRVRRMLMLMLHSTKGSFLPASDTRNSNTGAFVRCTGSHPKVRTAPLNPMGVATQTVASYIARDYEELARLRAERRPGRPSSTREDLLKRRIDTENREYDTGFWIPDMEDAENIGRLESWMGDWTSLSTLTYVRLSRDGKKRSSTFPPKAQS